MPGRRALTGCNPIESALRRHEDLHTNERQSDAPVIWVVMAWSRDMMPQKTERIRLLPGPSLLYLLHAYCTLRLAIVILSICKCWSFRYPKHGCLYLCIYVSIYLCSHRHAQRIATASEPEC